jgi:hypothetical protein
LIVSKDIYAPQQAEGLGLPFEAPCELHLTQLRGEGCQIISVIIGALGRRFCTFKAFRLQKLVIARSEDRLKWDYHIEKH